MGSIVCYHKNCQPDWFQSVRHLLDFFCIRVKLRLNQMISNANQLKPIIYKIILKNGFCTDRKNVIKPNIRQKFKDLYVFLKLFIADILQQLSISFFWGGWGVQKGSNKCEKR